MSTPLRFGSTNHPASDRRRVRGLDSLWIVAALAVVFALLNVGGIESSLSGVTGIDVVTNTLSTGSGNARFIQQGPKMVGSGAVGTANQGTVAVSADGNTALLGGRADNSNVGAAWVWVRSNGSWAQQGSKLVGTGEVGGGRFGFSVAISADGNTALVGGLDDNAGVGAAWVFTRSGGVWTQQGGKLVGTGGVGAQNQGASVALSADGNTAIVGGSQDDGFKGAAWVFTRSAGVWTQQGAKLLGTGANGNAQQGTSVALSADGDTALVGGALDGDAGGATWAFTRSGGVWTQQGSKLIGTGGVGFSQQGDGVSLSADGNTAAIGGHFDNSNAGAAWVFTRSGGVWTQQGSKLVGAGAVGAAKQGASLSLSGDGNTLLVGGFDDNSIGATWIWVKAGGVWTQESAKLVGSNATTSGFQGRFVALSSNGHTAIIGATGDSGGTGAMWAFFAPGAFDFDADGKTDRTVWRSSTGTWYSMLSGGSATGTVWGQAGDIDVAQDYDGDGKTDVAVFRPSDGTWYGVVSSNGGVFAVPWGQSGDTPLIGDVNGDGRGDAIIYRNGAWYFLQSSGGTEFLGWGLSTDVPLLPDWNGDGRRDPTVWRPSNGFWYGYIPGGAAVVTGWGLSTDVPLVGDWDGDGKSDLAVFRPSTGEWFIKKSSTGSAVIQVWGQTGDVPVASDLDGDGKSDFTVWRPSTGTWYTVYSSNGGTAFTSWGVNGDNVIGR